MWKAKSAKPYLRNKQQRAGGMAQVVEGLPSKGKALEFQP
jgi:hypothetical protein